MNNAKYQITLMGAFTLSTSINESLPIWSRYCFLGIGAICLLYLTLGDSK